MLHLEMEAFLMVKTPSGLSDTVSWDNDLYMLGFPVPFLFPAVGFRWLGWLFPATLLGSAPSCAIRHSGKTSLRIIPRSLSVDSLQVSSFSWTPLLKYVMRKRRIQLKGSFWRSLTNI